jgi:hypothetical protein
MKILNNVCYALNSLALGDVIAAAPVVKYMVDFFHHDPSTYLVAAKPAFRDILHFVPEERFRDLDKSWGLKDEAVVTLNHGSQGRITRNTPKKMHLTDFASYKLTDSLIPYNRLNYVPLKPVDISKYNTSFKRAILLVTSYRDKSRAWYSDYILETAEYVKSKKFLPVFVGKTDVDITDKLKSHTDLPDDISQYGLDLRNQTTIPELASIMKESRAVCGIDSGPIHLAGTTTTSIVCGYTSVAARHRIPYRQIGTTYTIEPDMPCAGCESQWIAHFWDFSKCYYKHNDCCKTMTAEKFIRYIKKIINA